MKNLLILRFIAEIHTENGDCRFAKKVNINSEHHYQTTPSRKFTGRPALCTLKLFLSVMTNDW